MKHPRVRFSTSYQKDIAAGSGFLRDARFDNGAALEEAVFSVAPELRTLLASKRTIPLAVRKQIRHLHLKQSDERSFSTQWFRRHHVGAGYSVLFLWTIRCMKKYFED